MVLQKKYHSNRDQTLIQIGVPTIFFKNKSALSFKQLPHDGNTYYKNQSLARLNNAKISLYGEKLSNRMCQTPISNTCFEQQKLQTVKVLQSKQLKDTDSQMNEKNTDIGKKRSNKELSIPDKINEIVESKRLKKSSPNKHNIRCKDKEFTLRDESFLGNPFLFEVSKDPIKFIEKPNINSINTSNIREVQLKKVNIVNCSISDNKPVSSITKMHSIPNPLMYKTRSISQLISDIDDRRLCSYNNGSGILSSRTMDQRFENIKRLLDFDISGSCISSNALSQSTNNSINPSSLFTESHNSFCVGLNTPSTTSISTSHIQNQRQINVLDTLGSHCAQVPDTSTRTKYSPKKGSLDIMKNTKVCNTVYNDLNKSWIAKPSSENESNTDISNKTVIFPVNDMYKKIDIQSPSIIGNANSKFLNATLEHNKDVAQSQSNSNTQFIENSNFAPAISQSQYEKKNITTEEKPSTQSHESSNPFTFISNVNSNNNATSSVFQNSNLSTTSLTVHSTSIKPVPSKVTLESDVFVSIPSDDIKIKDVSNKSNTTGLFSSSSNKSGESIFSNKYQCESATSSFSLDKTLSSSNYTRNSVKTCDQQTVSTNKQISIDETKCGGTSDKFALPYTSNTKCEITPSSIFAVNTNTKDLYTSNSIPPANIVPHNENKMFSQYDAKKSIFSDNMLHSNNILNVKPNISFELTQTNIESLAESSNGKTEINVTEPSNRYAFGENHTSQLSNTFAFGKSENFKTESNTDRLFGFQSSKNEDKPKEVTIAPFNQNIKTTTLSNNLNPPSYNSIFSQCSNGSNAITSDGKITDLFKQEPSNIFALGQKKDDLNNIHSKSMFNSSTKTISPQHDTNLFSARTQVETTSSGCNITNITSPTNIFGHASIVEEASASVNQLKNENIFKSDDCKVKESSIFDQISKDRSSINIFGKKSNVENDSNKSENIFNVDNTEKNSIPLNIFDKRSKDSTPNISIFANVSASFRQENNEIVDRENENSLNDLDKKSNKSIFDHKSKVKQDFDSATLNSVKEKETSAFIDKSSKDKNIFGQRSTIDQVSMGKNTAEEKVVPFNIFDKRSTDTTLNNSIFGKKLNTTHDPASTSQSRNENIFKVEKNGEKDASLGILESSIIPAVKNQLKPPTNFMFGHNTVNDASLSKNIFDTNNPASESKSKVSIDNNIFLKSPYVGQNRDSAIFGQQSSKDNNCVNAPLKKIAFNFDSKSEHHNSESDFKFGQSSQLSEVSSLNNEPKISGQSRQAQSNMFTFKAHNNDSTVTLNIKTPREIITVKRKP